MRLIRGRVAAREIRDDARRRLLHITRFLTDAGYDIKDVSELFPAIAGAAPVDSAIVAVTAPVALGVVEVAVASVPVQQAGPGRVAPLGVAFNFLPSVTGLATLAAVTATLRNGVAVAATQYGGAIVTNGAAGVGNVGGVLALGLAPAASQNVFAGASTSSSTATAAAAATQPILAGLIYLD